ncbi:MAG: bifunctional DNA-formamidopyrimidine glycosylase/DNA-(apurinic or apyrimidinic site) lyase [Robiginitomaculum sp.]|nr:bifunctional DNA-formamidopyrimidine glycosylase/DNA-(apurinic or apyrimidinic site) lyase [Robiginitomaculum sp.]
MPELPEVETVKNGLAPIMEGRTFKSVLLNRKDIRFPFPNDFITRLEGKTLIRLTRRAKFLVAELSSGETLLMHLGMSGRFTIEAGTDDPGHAPRSTSLVPIDSGNTNPKHDHVIFTMSGDPPPLIIYNDPRRFGFMELLEKGELGRMKDLGPEPLSNQFSGPILRDALTKKKSPIKTALLDQRVVAGLGNIYVCEALYDSKISPFRKSCDVSQDECETLSHEIKRTLEAAIKAGGSTLKDFAGVDGALGYFQHRFKVYGHEEHACPTTGCKGTITRAKQSGRSTFYCPHCQI